MITFTNVSKTYQYKRQTVYALKEMNLSIAEKEMVMLSGPSGSGKTTILNILAGLLTPTSGIYRFCGKTMSGSQAELSRFRSENIGYILQNFALLDDRPVFYNIALPLRYQKTDKAEIKSRVQETAAYLGIDDKLVLYPHMLSGGEYQRVAIARAIIARPRILLADEPTSSLDEEKGEEILALFQKLRDEGLTIVISSHSKRLAAACDRVIQVEKNRSPRD